MSKPLPLLALLTLGLATVAVPQLAHAQTVQVASQKPVLTTLHRFDGTHGARPTTLTPGTDGNFYGVTLYGGVNDNGTVFRMTPAGHVTTLFRFNGKNGQLPSGDLAEGTNGAFYGTTLQGGGSNKGTAFRITRNGQLTTLHEFTGDVDGSLPQGPLLAAADGSWYGTTSLGGSKGSGTVFHMTDDGQVTTLHTFVGTDGISPEGRLVRNADGDIYGTTVYGGAHQDGVVYRLATDGTLSVLHQFTGGDGEFSYAGLTAGLDGALYGLTYSGGIYFGGIAYKITLPGVFTTLHKFSADGHGIQPYYALTPGADGNFYGTTGSGGANNRGTVFSMTPAGQVTTIYKFHTPFDGNGPYGGVIFGSDGALYGTTYKGGAKGYGTIYKLTLPQ